MKRSLALFLSFVMILFSCLTLLSGCGEKDAYKITFSIDGKKTVVEVPRGETPVCPEELLSWETSEHFYKVTGWDKESSSSGQTGVSPLGTSTTVFLPSIEKVIL